MTTSNALVPFQLHTIDTAPEASRPALEGAKKAMGIVPNLYAVMAESPVLLSSYLALTKSFSQSSLSTTERHLVWQTINVENRCHYCVPAHTMLARADKVDDGIIAAVREDRPVDDTRLEALRLFTKEMVVSRGNPSPAQVEAFFAAGYTKQNLLDVVLGLAHKTISNFTNHLAATDVDAPFAEFAWTPPA